MAKLISIYWRDIPAQVVGRQGRTKVRKELQPRFARAIDRAAMRAGRVEKLESEFDDEYLESVVKGNGVRP